MSGSSMNDPLDDTCAWLCGHDNINKSGHQCVMGSKDIHFYAFCGFSSLHVCMWQSFDDTQKHFCLSTSRLKPHNIEVLVEVEQHDEEDVT